MASHNDLLRLCALLTVCMCVCCVQAEDLADENSSVQEGRTFGHHFLKRISFAMVPAAFTVGVITTLLAALTVVSMKGLGVGVILLVIAVGQILARSIPQPAPIVAAPAPAPIPIYYGRQTAPVPIPEPVWIEKDWH